MKWLAVFLAVALADALWARYIAAVSAHRAVGASCYATALLLATALATISYVHDPRLLLPAALGAFAGTWLSVRHG